MTAKKDPMVGRKVIVRSNLAGVLHGTLEAIDDAARMCILRDAVKLWRYQCRSSLGVQGLAAHGHDDPRGTMTSMVARQRVYDVVEVIECAAQ